MSDSKTVRLTLSSSPHMFNNETTSRIMLDVCIAMIPALIAAVLFYGWRSLLLTAVAVVTCVVTEYLSRKLMKRSNTIDDFSAVVTGMLIAFNVPVNFPIWMLIIGSVIAILVVKEFFGGLGQNFMNPALAARVILAASFAGAMGTIPQLSGLLPQAVLEPHLVGGGIDALAAATPLSTLKTYAQTGVGDLSQQLPSLNYFFLGFRTGVIGEISSLALILGAVYLLIRRIINPIIPLVFAGTVAIFMLISSGGDLQFTAYQLMSGGLLLGAIFMATDYATSPLTWTGKIIFAIGCGAITSMIRLFGSLPEGVSFSIIIMNLLVPHIERWTRPIPFGKTKEQRQLEKQKAKVA